MKNTFHAYFIQCITNMHVGSGDANYGIVDKLVQRDPVTDFPTIHPSSLKGALRAHFESVWGEGDKVNTIFGKEAKGTDSETGEYKFLGADLVSLPVRCNFDQYVLGVNKEQIDHLNAKAELLIDEEIFLGVVDKNQLVFQLKTPNYDLYAEDIKIENDDKVAHKSLFQKGQTLKCFDTKYATFNGESFKTIAKDLPVIARNHIEDGTSNNLWYEEVVPHQTVFITFIAGTGNLLTEFEAELAKAIVQIGGNATIGYGLCKFYKIKQ